jgi:two-component system response regulator AtoC
MTGRLAIVDDDPGFAGYLSTRLRSQGYAVDVFNTGASLLERLSTSPAPNVVLLDMLMPGLDGIDTLRAVRRAHPEAQVIMLSGSQIPSQIVEAVRLGAADYVLKPNDPSGLGEAALELAIRNALERETLTADVARLRAQLAEGADGTQPCWAKSEAMARVMAMVDRVADSDVGVLLRGESGVGKEVISRELHRRSSRRGRTFVKVNCAALPADLLESELFGYERGAFTGAGHTRIGKFEFAQGGTMLLDEIGEMAPALQAKILHVLQDGAFTRLGSNQQVEADVRIISATNRDLEAMMRAGTFREDLYYRLQVIELRVPALRERREEIPVLTEFFLGKYAAAYRRPAVHPSRVLMEALLEHTWPGNIRELENMMKRFVVLQDESMILSELARLRRPVLVAVPIREPQLALVPASVSTAPPVDVEPAGLADDDAEAGDDDVVVETADGVNLRLLSRMASMRAEREAISQALSRFHWNRRKAAAYLNVSYKTLLNKMKECGISDVVEN